MKRYTRREQDKMPIRPDDPAIRMQAEQLLSQMTLAQKIGQMLVAERASCTPEQVRQYHLGAVMSSAGSIPDDNSAQGWLSMLDDYWQASTLADENHLGVPILYGVDAVHGHNNLTNSTIFPHNIGLGASHNLTLLNDIAVATRNELLATGIDWVFAPNLAVAQNPHWGRFYESYHQNPTKVAEFAHTMVTGLQGQLGGDGVVACVKHWVGDGATSLGIDQGDAKIDFATLNATHIAPYRAAIDAGAMTVMVSFSSWNGDKCHSHRFLLTEVLKSQLNFEGFVVSDMNGIDYLSEDFYLAVAQGVNAGIDMFMISENWQQFISHLCSHVEMGTVLITRINDAVRRILSVKIASGLLALPKPSLRAHAKSNMLACGQHQKLANQAAAQSLVVLKNDANILPISPQAKVLVTGKNADNIGHQCGGFTHCWQGVSGNEGFRGGNSIWQGIKNIVPQAVLVHGEGLARTNVGRFDVAIVVIGEIPYAESQGDIYTDSGEVLKVSSDIVGQINLSVPYGRSLSLKSLHPEDSQLIEYLSEKGIKVLTVIVSGRPLVINEELEASDAVVAAWLPGSQGQGISDVLFGIQAASGKLPFDWPAKQLNSQFDSKPEQLFKCGFGLSYPKA